MSGRGGRAGGPGEGKRGQRQEARDRQQEDEARRGRAKKRHESFELLRTSLNFLREREEKWRTRKIAECERIKEEEKKDRLAMAKEKKRWYGQQRLSKEENKRIKMRTEERLDIARGKTNLWRKFGLGRLTQEVKDEELDAWEEIQRLVLELEEEDGDWMDRGINIQNITIRKSKLAREESKGVKEQEAAVL